MDEVGRGALAGPLVAAAVVLPRSFRHPLLRDSKQLTPHQREEVEPLIRRAARAVELVTIGVEVINRWGIGWANREAFRLLMDRIVAPMYLCDGNLVIPTPLVYRSVVGGDHLVPAISAASIVAKVHRDHLMRELHHHFPQYWWHSNKGYGTPAHLRALRQHGSCPHHRLSFIHPEQLELLELEAVAMAQSGSAAAT